MKEQKNESITFVLLVALLVEATIADLTIGYGQIPSGGRLEFSVNLSGSDKTKIKGTIVLQNNGGNTTATVTDEFDKVYRFFNLEVECSGGEESSPRIYHYYSSEFNFCIDELDTVSGYFLGYCGRVSIY